MDGSLKWAVDVKLPGMVHARNVKPPVAGAKLISIDESSVRGIPGFVKVVSKGNYVAVVCEREEQAIKAARQLKVNWQKPATPPFPTSEDLFSYMRGATPTSSARPERGRGSRRGACTSAAKVVEAEYDVPFQGHTAFGSGSRHGRSVERADDDLFQRHEVLRDAERRRAVSQMPRDQVRVVWMEGPQGYGRTAADDAGFEAAFLAKEIGRPVRVQWMRDEETAWDTKGPAFTFKMRGGLDAQGNLVALDYNARAADYNHLGYNEPDTVLIAQLMGMRGARRLRAAARPRRRTCTPSRTGALATQVVSLPLVWETPLRTGNLRDPNGPQVTFASESFIDELAAAAKADPVEFRLRLLTAGTTDDSGFKRARSIAVVKAAAEAYGWDARPSPKPLGSGEHSHRPRDRVQPSATRPSSQRSPRSR